MPHHHAGAVDAPLDAFFIAHQTFRIMLGTKVRVVQAFRLIKHVFAEDARVQPCRGDGAGVVEHACPDGSRQVQRMLGAIDVGGTLRFGAGSQVVDRGQVEEMLYLARQRAQLRRRHATLGLGHVAMDHFDASQVPARFLGNGIELLLRILAHQYVHSATALQQVGDQVTTNEPRGAGDEITHGNCPCCVGTAPPPCPSRTKLPENPSFDNGATSAARH